MTRDLRVLGIACLVALSVSAVVAVGASAQQGVLTAPEPVTLVGTQVGTANENALTAFGGIVRCPESTYTGHKISSTPHQPVPSGATEGTLTPHFNQSECVSISGGSEFSVTISMNGCDIALETGKTVAEDKWSGSGSLKCPAGSEIEAAMFSGAAHGFKVCSIKAGAQTGVGSVIAEDTPEGGRVSGTISGLKGSRSGLCGASSTESAEIHLNAVIEGENEAGEWTDVNVSD